MKKCPFCKADIEDNARFCLYCMKPLNEKEVIPPLQRKLQWWPFALAAVLLIALLLAILLMPRGSENLPAGSTGETSSFTGQTADESTPDTQSSDTASQENPLTEEMMPTAETSGTNQKPTQNPNPETQKPTQSSAPTTKPTQPEPTTGTTPPSTTPTTPATKPPATSPTSPATPTPTTPPTTSPAKPQETTQPEETVEETTLPENTTPPETPKNAVYTYRAARAGDDFNANYTNSGNDIVITGISQSAADGVYDIPSYIDGKKVIAIVANAFSGSNAKTVYIPATVKTIWNYAFAGCGLTDIYFRGNAIYAENNAFPRGITIHCSASCSDRNFRYYKDSAANYGATWAQWNG